MELGQNHYAPEELATPLICNKRYRKLLFFWSWANCCSSNTKAWPSHQAAGAATAIPSLLDI